MKQSDVINSVVNTMLKTEEKVVDGKTVTIKFDVDSIHFERNVMFLIEKEYKTHSKMYKGDPTRMIEKISKLVRKYAC